MKFHEIRNVFLVCACGRGFLEMYQSNQKSEIRNQKSSETVVFIIQHTISSSSMMMILYLSELVPNRKWQMTDRSLLRRRRHLHDEKYFQQEL